MLRSGTEVAHAQRLLTEQRLGTRLRSGVGAEGALLGRKWRRLVLSQGLVPVALQVLQAEEGVHAIPGHAHQLQVPTWHMG